MKLHNLTTGQSWDYETEAQLKTVAKLYAMQHPKAGLAVTINGRYSVIRNAK